MNPLLVKFRNDRIFREGTFPEMRFRAAEGLTGPAAFR